METPLSTTRITRSQNKAVSTISSWDNNNEESQKCNKSAQKPKQRSGFGLIDITNGSPIVGLANMSETCTPSNKVCTKTKTPASGESLLRGQVKTLLHKVEQLSDISKFLSFDTVFGGGGRHGLKAAFLSSPAGLLAPTPANTPQVFNFNDGFESLESLVESPIEDQLIVSKVLNRKINDGSENEKDIISRSLFSNFSEKSKEDDKEDEVDASIWSLQVNASARDEDTEKEGELETKNEEIEETFV